MVQILDINGKPLFSTNKHGKVRRLLRDKKAKIIKNEPFTIQLLCPIEESGEFQYKENNSMTIIVSNNTFIPSEVTDVTTVMSYDEFLTICKSDDGFDMQENRLMFDVDGMTEEIYQCIKIFIDNGMKDYIKFFMYNPTPYINEPISIMNISNKNQRERQNEMMMSVNYGTQKPLITSTTTLVYSATDNNAKNELMQNFNTQLTKKGFICVDCSLDKMSIEEIAQNAVKFQNEMMQRFKQMESEQVNNAYKLKEELPYRALFIHDLDKIYSSDKYKSIELIKCALGSLVRLARAVCMKVFISTSTLTGINSDILNNSQNKIVIGSYNEELAMRLFDTEQVVSLPKGIGLVSSGDECVVFSINEIKNL